MARRLVALLTTALIGAAALAASAAPASAAKAHRPHPAAVDFTGIVALSNCSGSVVRMPGSADSDPAMVLTNGHCNEHGMPNAGQVFVNQSSTRTFSLLDKTGQRKLGTLTAKKIDYSTMTDTDVTLYQLNTTYAQIKQKYNTPALEVAASHPTSGVAIKVVSGYWKKIYSCSLNGFVYKLREDQWTWKDSLRYTKECNVIGGTSGSPVEDAGGKIVGINNTINENGEQCTFDNPCEVDQNGKITVNQGIGYAQETYLLAACVTKSEIDLNKSGCQLPKPA